MRKTLTTLAASALMLGGSIAAAHSADAAPQPVRQRYANCTAAHADYPNGFRKAGARDRVRGVTPPVPVRLLVVRTPLYRLNTHLDRDRDGVACEAR